MPSATKVWQATPAFQTFGRLPPLAFLKVAILLILTLSLVISKIYLTNVKNSMFAILNNYFL